MRPLSVHARNFRTWDEVSLEFPQGCVAIVGDNGAGKSSLLQIVELALFGPRSRTLADYLTADSAETEMEVTLVFEHRGSLYRVRRVYSARGRGLTKVDLERSAHAGDHLLGGVENGWQPLTRETARETQEAIEQLLGLSRETFRASAFLAQGDGAAFTEAEPRERKAILAEILDLGVWETLLALVRGDLSTLDHDLNTIRARLEVAEHELAAKSATVAERDAHATAKTEAEAILAVAETALAAADARHSAAREQAAALSAARESLEERTRAYQETEQRIDRLNAEHFETQEALQEKPGLETQGARVGELELAQEAARALATARADGERAEETIERLDRALLDATEQERVIRESETPTCPTCGQETHGEARSMALRSARARTQEAEIDILNAQRALTASVRAQADARSALGEWEDLDVASLLDVARRAQTRLAGMEERERRLEQINEESAASVAQLVSLEHSVKDAQARVAELGEVEDMDMLERQAQEARLVRDARRERVAELDRALARCDERLDRIGQVERASATDREQRDRLHADREILATLERAFGRDGIPALILENAAIPQIETEANRILADLGTSFRVELRTQRALKSGDGIREALDILVIAGGVERPYETFSGGERTRLNLALRIALARLLAHRRGADVRFLAIDEPDFLDQEGMDRLAAVLRGLTGDFETVLVVSHHPALREAFDQTITVVRDGERSTIATNDRAEAVVA